ncbi:MAG: glycosyltransferase family 39 protein [Bryobacteraceae bacterium]
MRGACRLAGAALAVAAILFAIPAAKPLLLDNMDFPAVARATAETGLPIYYRGEESPRHSGLYHPPLYIYLLAAWFRLWGFGEVQARLFGFFCALLQGGLVLALARTLLGARPAARAGPWFWAVFLLNPFTLQGAAVADIDTTVYGPLLLAALAAALRLTWTTGEQRTRPVRGAELAGLGLLTALCFWAKLTTVLSVIPVILLLHAGRGGWRRALRQGGAAMAAGGLLFLVSYWFYGRLTGQDTGYTFQFLGLSLSQRSGRASGMEWLAAHWETLRQMALWQALWTGLLPWAVAVACLVWVMKSGWGRGDRAMKDGALVLAWGLFVTGFYCFLTYTFGKAPFKYAYPAWGVICASVAVWMSLAWERLSNDPAKRWAVGAATALAAACFVISGRYLRDRAILVWRAEPADVALLAIPAAGALLGLVLWRRRAGPWLYFGSSMAWMGAMLGLALTMARAPYPTTYNYGQEGFGQTVCFIEQHTRPEEFILSMKDVGFRTGRRYFENYGYIYGGESGAAAAERLLAEGRVRFAIFTEGNGADFLGANPALERAVHARCELVRSYGHYRIYDCGGRGTQREKIQ